MAHIAGGKITRSHTTAIAEMALVVRQLESWPEVQKIVLGVIVAGLPKGTMRIKCLPITGGLRVEVRGASSKQQVFVYSSDIDLTRQRISTISL